MGEAEHLSALVATNDTGNEHKFFELRIKISFMSLLDAYFISVDPAFKHEFTTVRLPHDILI